MINTVLGKINECDVKSTLTHEHICCYCEFLYQMSLDKYIDKTEVEKAAVNHLKYLKEKYGLNLFLDCTPANIGRDVELLKRVSEKSGVHIVCSTGLYYTYNPIISSMNAETIAEHYVNDAKSINAGIIKAAVEEEKISDFNKKLLISSALAQSELGLPIVLHTNANNKNGLKALEILFNNGVNPQKTTVGHLSDTDDIEYVLEILSLGCYVALDRLHNNTSVDYISKKIKIIQSLCDAGYGDKILLSHDDMFFTGFSAEHKVQPIPRFEYVYKNILPRLDEITADTIMRKNPIAMLSC